jgi:hypothetical protein
MKNKLVIPIITLLILSTVGIFVPTTLAKHSAEVRWIQTNNMVIVDSPINHTMGANWQDLYTAPSRALTNNPRNPVVFEVNNTGFTGLFDSITSVEVQIPQNDTGYSLFYLQDANVTKGGWITETIEFDPAHEVRSFRFRSDVGKGIAVGDVLNFSMYFRGGPEVCRYDFTIFTHDDGNLTPPPELHRHVLTLVMDKTQPTTTIFIPTGVQYQSGTPMVNGTIVPCGRDYFDIDVWASDEITHDTGIPKIYITIDNGTSWFYDGIWYDFIYNSTLDLAWVNTLPGNTWKLSVQATVPGSIATTRVWNLPAGNHNLTARATDGVGNIYETVVYFTYTPPLKPSIFITPSSGTSALRSWFNSTSLKLESEQVVYKQKTLGTTVTVTGIHFGISVGVTVNITLPVPPYPSSGPGQYYGNMVEFTVSKTTTQPDGTFTTTFVFPQAPNGTYTVRVFSDPCNKTTTFEVSPEVIYKPDEIIGPALIEVIATGFTAQNLTTPSWLFMVPDALQSMNTQIDRWWFIDGNGTLQNWLNTYTAGVETVSTTLNWPWMQPGTYTVEIKHINGDKWTGQTWTKIPCCIGGNKITVLETLSLLISIKDDTVYIRTGTDSINAKLDTLKPIVDRIDGNVVTINTTLGRIEATINQLSPVITRIDGNVVTINTVVGQINTTMATVGPQLAAIGPDIATIKTSVGTGLSGTVTSIKDDVATIKTDAGDVHAQLPNITNYIIVVIVLTLIAALAAIACVFLVFRKIA